MSPVSSLLYRAINRLLRRAAEAELGEMARRSAEIQKSVRLYPGARLDNYCDTPGAIHIGLRSHIRGRLVTMPPRGTIRIGEDCYIGEGSNLWSCHSIDVGDRVLIAHNVNIHDTNAHPLDAGLRSDHFRHICSVGFIGFDCESIASKPVAIEDDVWIGFNAIVLKGVTIGRGAIVGAGAVVTRDVPSGTIVCGNPAVAIRNLAK